MRTPRQTHEIILHQNINTRRRVRRPRRTEVPAKTAVLTDFKVSKEILYKPRYAEGGVPYNMH
jgi:hypothetical protein